MLAELGLSDLQEQVYLELLHGRVDSAVGLAAALAVGLPEVRAAVAGLAEHGLVRTSSNGTGGLRAAPPDLAVDALLLQRLAHLQRARLRLPEWAAQHLPATGRPTPGDAAGEVVETAVGAAAITDLFVRFQRSAQQEIRAFDSPPYSLPNDQNYTELEALDRGVAYRVVYDRSALELPHAVAQIAAYVGSGEQARVSAGIPLKLGVADRQIAMLQHFPDPRIGQPRALLVRGTAWVDVCLALFNEVWERALPLSFGRSAAAAEQVQDPTGPAASDIHMLSLLLSGMSDRAVAAQLGVSLRTVQRRVRELMDLTGTRTRMQLGWYAANRGWL